MNKIILMGNITQDIDLKHIGETTIANFNLAVQRKFKVKGEYKTDFIKCVSFGKQAETIAKFFSKGSRILIDGELNIDVYEKDGKMNYMTKVKVDGFNFIDKAKKDDDGFGDFIPKNETIDVNDNFDLPF